MHQDEPHWEEVSTDYQSKEVRKEVSSFHGGQCTYIASLLKENKYAGAWGLDDPADRATALRTVADDRRVRKTPIPGRRRGDST